MIERAGRALHGEHWVMPLARELGVNRRTVQRWARGEEVPDDVRAMLFELLVARHQDIGALLYRWGELEQ